MKNITISLAILVISLSYSQGLITNGDFEQTLDIGWQRDSNGVNITINRATIYDPDPDYEAQVYKGAGTGFAELSQMVDIPSTDLLFTCNAKIYAFDNDADTLTWAAAALIISYLDDGGATLGETRICNFSTPCPWLSTPTCHLIIAIDSFWHNYGFNIDDELANVPGVNPADVQKISIALYDTTLHTC